MARYRTNGLTTATTGTDAHAIAEIWNPSSTKRIWVVELAANAITAPAAGAGLTLRRSTVKGTAAATVTPNAESSDERDAAPDSAFTLELGAFSGQPTLATGELGLAWMLAVVAGSGIVYPVSGKGICVPPGTGLCLVNRAAVIFPASEVSFVVDD